MKLQILLLLFSLSLSSIAAAQGLTAGVQVGYGISNAKMTNQPSYWPDNDARSAYTAAANITYMGKGCFGVSVEPGFTRKGFSFGKTDTKLNYLTMPVLLQIRPVRIIRISLGAEVAYLLNATHMQFGKDYNSTGHYSSVDLGGVGGLDVKLHKRLDIFARYSYGILTIEKITLSDETGAETGEMKEFNRSLTAGIRFNILTTN